MADPAKPPAPALRVFLSYSRRDADFVRRLAAALEARGYMADFDQSTHHADTGDTGIAPTDDWWLRLQDMIAAADVMILCVSPDSAASKVVDEEIAYARSLSKRIIAITCREVDFTTVPPRLSALNVSHWFIQQGFEPALIPLSAALDRDVDWLRASARYTVEAKAWDSAAKARDRLLFGEEIAAAEAWSARRPAGAPELSELVLAFLAASRAEQTRRDRAQRNVRRAVTGLIAAAFIITLTGAWFVINGQRNLGRAQSLMLARTAEQAVTSGDYVRALHIAAIASHNGFLSPSTPEARIQLQSNAQFVGQQAQLVHDGPVTGAVLSRDGSHVLTWSYGNVAKIWDATSGEQVGRSLRPVSGAALSKDGSRILTWSENAARLWDAYSGKQIGPSLDHDGLVSGATFSKDERHILTWSDDNTARLWDAFSGRQVGLPLTHDGPVSGAAFSHDERRILTWSGTSSGNDVRLGDNTARLWDTSTGEQLGSALTHNGPVSGAIFSKNDSYVITWSYDDTARIWDATSGLQIGSSFKHDFAVVGAAATEHQSRILTWSFDGTARLWDTATGVQIGPSLQHEGPVSGAVFSKNESRILTWGYDGTARMWDAADGVQIGPSLKHDGPVSGAAFSKNEHRILTWSEDNTARLWDVSSGRQIGSTLRHDGGITGAVLSNDESRILTWSDDNTARLWNTAIVEQASPSPTPEGAFVDGMEASKDRSRLLVWRNDTVWILDATTHKQVGPAFAYDSPISNATFLEGDNRILASGNDNTTKTWDVSWAMSPAPNLSIISSACTEKLNGARTLDARTIELAPILRGREGEDVCAWAPPWYDGALQLLLGWAFP